MIMLTCVADLLTVIAVYLIFDSFGSEIEVPGHEHFRRHCHHSPSHSLCSRAVCSEAHSFG